MVREFALLSFEEQLECDGDDGGSGGGVSHNSHSSGSEGKCVCVGGVQLGLQKPRGGREAPL